MVFDLHLTTHQSNIGVQLRKNNQITHAYLNKCYNGVLLVGCHISRLDWSALLNAPLPCLNIQRQGGIYIELVIILVQRSSLYSCRKMFFNICTYNRHPIYKHPGVTISASILKLRSVAMSTNFRVIFCLF